MPLYEKGIKQKLIAQNVDTFLEACDSDQVKAGDFLEIASKISPTLRGAMSRRIKQNGYEGRTTGWYFLDTWYQQDPGMNIEQLIAALKSNDVRLVALAEELMPTSLGEGGINLKKQSEPKPSNQEGGIGPIAAIRARRMRERDQRLLLQQEESGFQKMKRIIVEEMKQICSKNQFFEETFARDLDIGTQYKLWAQSPFNLGKPLELKIDYILEMWKCCEGLAATPEAMCLRLDYLSKNKDRMYNRMADRLSTEFIGTTQDNSTNNFHKMKKILVEEITMICSMDKSFEETFAEHLDIGSEYKLWVQLPSNMGKPLELKIDYILETWQNCEGDVATPEFMQVRVGHLAENKDRKYKKMADRLCNELGY